MQTPTREHAAAIARAKGKVNAASHTYFFVLDTGDAEAVDHADMELRFAKAKLRRLIDAVCQPMAKNDPAIAKLRLWDGYYHVLVPKRNGTMGTKDARRVGFVNVEDAVAELCDLPASKQAMARVIMVTK